MVFRALVGGAVADVDQREDDGDDDGDGQGDDPERLLLQGSAELEPDHGAQVVRRHQPATSTLRLVQVVVVVVAVDRHEDLVHRLLRRGEAGHVHAGLDQAGQHVRFVGVVVQGQLGVVAFDPHGLPVRGSGRELPGVAQPHRPSAEAVLDLCDGAVRLRAAVFEHDDAVAEPFDLFHLVGHHQHRRAGLLLVLDDPHQQPPVDRVEPLGRLVQDEQVGGVHDRDPELDLLLLPAGELVDPGAGLVREVDPLQVVHRPRLGLTGSQALEAAEVDHHVQDLLLLVQAPLLGQVPQRVALLRGVGAPVDLQRAAGRLVDPQQGRMVVVLPDPLLPRNPNVSPRPTWNERSWITVVRPKLMVNPSISITRSRTPSPDPMPNNVPAGIPLYP